MSKFSVKIFSLQIVYEIFKTELKLILYATFHRNNILTYPFMTVHLKHELMNRKQSVTPYKCNAQLTIQLQFN